MASTTANKKEKLKVAIVGTGIGSVVHYPGYEHHPSFDPVIIVGNDEQKTKNIADKLGIEYSTNWTEVVDNPEIDVISIATPPKIHSEIANAALKNGKHVLCEKPLSKDLESAIDMSKNAEESGKTAMINFEFRYLPSRAYFTELIKSGYIGDIYTLTINISSNARMNPIDQSWDWYSSKSEGGGVLSALGSHYIDFIMQIFEIKGVYGRRYTQIPKRLNNKTGKMKNVTADDAVTVIFDVANVQVVLQISTVTSHGEGTVITANGSKGTLVIKEDQRIYGAIIGENATLVPLSIPMKYQLIRLKHHHVLVPSFIKILDELNKGINTGLSHSPNFQDGLKVQTILDAINKSHTKKKYIAIK